MSASAGVSEMSVEREARGIASLLPRTLMGGEGREELLLRDVRPCHTSA